MRLLRGSAGTDAAGDTLQGSSDFADSGEHLVPLGQMGFLSEEEISV